MQHFTDQSIAWSSQIPFDVPSDPTRGFGGVVVVGRDYIGPSVVMTKVSHHVSIVQKRDQTDMELLRKMLAGLMQRPNAALPNAEYHDMRAHATPSQLQAR